MGKLAWFGCVLLVACAVGACKEEVQFDDDGSGAGSSVGGSGAGTSVGGSGAGTSVGGGATTANKVDVLLVVDNSRGNEHVQTVLAQSVPDLLTGVTNAGYSDIHIGVVSSSLGGLGGDACQGSSSATENDRGHLLSRGAMTYENLGFLAWDPNQTKTPPGETDLTALTADTAALIIGAQSEGCGYESTLEAFYRFLIEPDPYQDVIIQSGEAVLSGTDQTILQQRQDFLRPDSLVMVVVASDENDCSTRAGGISFYTRQVYQPGSSNPFRMLPGRAACAVDPNAPCCTSCFQDPAPGCDDSQDQCDPLSPVEDNINLRCFDQKRRFGLDFLYPISRYTDGLTASQVADRFGNIVGNPLFAGERGPNLVLFAGLVGVPWQLVTRGGDPAAGAMTGSEVDWPLVVGSPDSFVPPGDPHMVEAIDPRGGLPPPGSNHDADPYHGHEFSVSNRDDLQYACTFELATPVDCLGAFTCECQDPTNDNPVCQDPTTNQFGTTQYRAPAQPGIRQLQLMQSLGDRSVVSSACPAQTTDPSLASFGYRPAFSTLVDLAAARLAP